MGKTQFPLGGYFHTPNSADAVAEARFESQVGSFSSLMGQAPQFLTYYVDQNKPVGDWASNASWQAYSAAISPAANGVTPVIGLPMTSYASWMSADQQYKAFASGQYDDAIRGVVKAWQDQGFSTQYWRPGWEMNLSSMPSYAGTYHQTQSDWVSAFQHISSVLRQAGQADGVDVKVVWNPNVTNYDEVGVIQNLYPGNGFVDIIGADMYAGAFPYAPLYDWGKNDGSVAGSLSEWLANPANLTHYWTYPAATAYSNDGSGGHNLSLQTLLDFARSQGKPFAVPETGAGSSEGGHDVSDDAAFPGWLAQTLSASGNTIAFVNVWDANADGNYDFSTPGAKPGEAAAWAANFGVQGAATNNTLSASASASVTISASISEDAWQGNAQYTIAVDGKQVGGVRTATASHASGATETVSIGGDWDSGAHSIGISFINDAYGGSAASDRNLYVNAVSYDGQATSPASVSLFSNGTSTFQLPSAGSELTLLLAEDAYQGDARFSVAVDGVQVTTGTVTASNAAGTTQAVSVPGSLAAGTHDVAVSFLNDLYDGTAATDRNLYVKAMAVGRTAMPGTTTTLYGQQTDHFSIAVPYG